jgi:CheY-like chemotaxis protein/predicted regulator of Ras-like GTPase activity (Roadblock/LC7/MglB family)
MTPTTSVLVVEDDPLFAKAVGRDLEEQGFEVLTARSVGDALVELAGHSVDVLLTDLQLGSEDGIGLLEALRDVSPQTRAVLMSAFASARDYQRAIELGAVGVLCKPFSPPDLIQCIRRAVECETGFRGTVHGLSLVDMIQMFNYGRRSVGITISGRSAGRLYLRDGQIVHAEHRDLTGEEAVRSILAMPGGALSTSAFPDTLPQTVTRDCREVLLDAFRAIDEGHICASPEEVDFDLAFEIDDSDTAPTATSTSAHERILERVRQIEGYLASCLTVAETGEVLSAEGAIDLNDAAAPMAQALRSSRHTIEEMGDDDQVEDMLVTTTTQYHLLRPMPPTLEVFVHLVLDREGANPALARIALDNAVRCV